MRLIARDTYGRQSEASVKVYVDAVSPTFVGLRVPARLDHREDEMHIVVGSSIPGVLVIEKRAYVVDTKAKSFTVPIPRGRQNLVLPMVLVAQGMTTTFFANIERY